MTTVPDTQPHSQASHTPGPWAISGDQLIAEEHTIAKIMLFAPSVGARGAAQRWANARLIAAAPDLLAASKLLVQYLDEMWGERTLQSAAQFGGTSFTAREDLRAAIVKAEGRTA